MTDPKDHTLVQKAYRAMGAPKTAAKLARIPEEKWPSKIGRTVGGVIIALVAGGGAFLHWNQYLVAGLGILAGSVWAGEMVTAPFAAIAESAVNIIKAVRGKSE